MAFKNRGQYARRNANNNQYGDRYVGPHQPQHFNRGNYKKKSGASYVAKNKKGNNTITAWNFQKKRGFLSMVASPLTERGLSKQRDIFKRKDLQLTVTSESGRVTERWVCSFTNKTTGETFTKSGYFDRKEMKLRIPSMGMVASCRAKNGGYFGKIRVSDND